MKFWTICVRAKYPLDGPHVADAAWMARRYRKFHGKIKTATVQQAYDEWRNRKVESVVIATLPASFFD